MNPEFKYNVISAVNETAFERQIGNVTQYVGNVVESNGPEVYLGELCEIHSINNYEKVKAEVVGFKNRSVQLIPYGNLHGIQIGSDVIGTGKSIEIPVGNEILGKIIDPFGNELKDQSFVQATSKRTIFGEPENPLIRPKLRERLETNIKFIDRILPIAKGQKLGIFSGSGVGKSTLLGMLARNVKSDVNIIALIGERGREVVEFIEDILGEEGLKKSVLVVATSEQSPLTRSHAAYTATTIAEYFAQQGNDVLLMMDSLSRYAMAQREIGLSIGEPPTTKGYTPSVFTQLPKLIERAGTFACGGSITGLYTILTESDDMNDPIADYARATLDGHIVLSRNIANSGVYPAIDIKHSKSRLIDKVLSRDEISTVMEVLRIYSQYEQYKDMINIGAYKHGQNPELDFVIKTHAKLQEYFSQNANDEISDNSLDALLNILRVP